MKLLFIILTILSSFFANLEKKTIQSDFVVTVQEPRGMEQYPGSFTMKGKQFRFTMEGMDAAYDGKTMYSYSDETEELTLTEPTEEELAETNPLLFAKAVVDVCSVTEKADKDGVHTIVTLTPNDPEQMGVNRFILKIRTADLMPLQLEMREGQKVTTLRLNNPKFINSAPAFVIEPTETTFVNDLRF